MNENDSNSFLNKKKNSEHKNKELLYNLFYEIKSEILGSKIEIEEDEYQENLKKNFNSKINNIYSRFNSNFNFIKNRAFKKPTKIRR